MRQAPASANLMLMACFRMLQGRLRSCCCKLCRSSSQLLDARSSYCYSTTVSLVASSCRPSPHLSTWNVRWVEGTDCKCTRHFAHRGSASSEPEGEEVDTADKFSDEMDSDTVYDIRLSRGCLCPAYVLPMSCLCPAYVLQRPPARRFGEEVSESTPQPRHGKKRSAHRYRQLLGQSGRRLLTLREALQHQEPLKLWPGSSSLDPNPLKPCLLFELPG